MLLKHKSPLTGLKICGGCGADGTEDYGIFVKRVLPGGLAATAGEPGADIDALIVKVYFSVDELRRKKSVTNKLVPELFR